MIFYTYNHIYSIYNHIHIYIYSYIYIVVKCIPCIQVISVIHVSTLGLAAVSSFQGRAFEAKRRRGVRFGKSALQLVVPEGLRESSGKLRCFAPFASHW